MKKIKIKNVVRADKSAIHTKLRKHSVYLGNGVTRYFADRKKADRFLSETNRFLNEKIFEVNMLYVDVFSEYRRVWFVIMGKRDELCAESMVAQLHQVERTFNLMINRAGFTNGNHFVFKYFIDILNILTSICESIAGIYRSKKNYPDAHHIAVIEKRIDGVRKQIEGYAL